ncbi:acyclic terpene utilization AtuA family protein [Polycyclovorans algicola]|uniref:acyclic terpene utilization AtuA family protein n=1 Tax=Polycyclovorans algicola TaxID=616992 RepID=UPI0004A73C84|nr:acyclic terpene utilization AtuA family protein [Polycyclovorans algicola]
MKEPIRIGCAAAFWGDSAEGARELVARGQLDYLVFDYLAEITMSLLARARAKDPNAGFATDFPAVIAALAPQIKAQGIKVVSNAGGVNPEACKAVLDGLLQAKGIDLTVAIIRGDDLLPRAAEFADVREMFSGAPLPDKLWSMNAYLGAFPIAQALAGGADIVLTGRCVDSAVALGPLIHEFGWQADDFDRLSAGSLIGHLIECGTQVTGGVSTDWQAVAADWDRMGFPVAECHADGRCVITKPEGSGGRVCVDTVTEQLVYEVGDPGAYLLPDVTCDWRNVQVSEIGPDRVEVRGARGMPPGDDYKVSATWQDGFRATGIMMIGGRDAVARAEAVANAILTRTRRLFAERGLADYRRTDIEVLGSETNWGAQARRGDTREVILKLAVHHDDRKALELFGRECIPAATSMAQGITGFAGGRPAPTPLVRLFSCLLPKSAVNIEVDGKAFISPLPLAGEGQGERAAPEGGRGVQTNSPAPAARPLPAFGHPLPQAGEGNTTVPLIELAYGRSGDKGDSANIGVLARKPEHLPLLREQLTAEAVQQYLAHFVKGTVRRYEWPGLHGFNFLLTEALGGGGMASLRHDPQGKMLAQILMDFPIVIPA